MNNIVAGGIGFTVGAVISGVCTFLYLKKMVKIEIKDIIIEMQNSVFDGDEVQPGDIIVGPTEVVHKVSDKMKKGKIEDYTAYYNSPEEVNRERFAEYVDSMGEEMYGQPVNRNLEEEPFTISETSFEEEFVDYEKAFMFYYAEDGVLTYEDEKVVEDEFTVVGDACSDFPEVKTVHVRNHEKKTDYEIAYVDGSYMQCVLGIPPDRE